MHRNVRPGKLVPTVVLGCAVVMSVSGMAVSGAQAVQRDPSGGGSGWTKWKDSPDLDPVRVPACGTILRIVAPVNDTETRTKLLANGNTRIEARGRLVVKVRRLDDGRSARVDASGESIGRHAQIAYANGNFRYRATGPNFITWNSPSQRPDGLPMVIVERGPIDFLARAPVTNPDGTETLPTAQIRRIGAFRSVCGLLR